MTRGEVLDLIADMVLRWPRDRTLDVHGTQELYVKHLADLDPEQVRAAVDAWYRDGEDWAPSPTDLVRRVAELAFDVPHWGQVKAAILGWDTPTAAEAPAGPADCPHGLCEGDGMVVDLNANTTYRCRCWPERLAAKRARRTRHPLVAEFLQRTNPREFGDLEADRIAEAQIRGKWDAFVRDVIREVTYRGINPAGLPALERITTAPAERARLTAKGATTKGPRRPDHLRLINAAQERTA